MDTESQAASDFEPVDQLADEFLDRYRQGERPSITEYVKAHPDLALEIRELFPTLVVLERLGPRPDDLAGAAANADVGKVPQQLGEYRILREVGRGGMGVVYEAEQMPLGRHVALKVLPAAAVLNPGVLTRFQNEVRAAARLHHTNIVPVFGVGEDQGTHYYAMQFIAGHGLDVVLEELRRLRDASHEPCTNSAGEPRCSSAHAKVSSPPPNAEHPAAAGTTGSSQPSLGNSTSHGTSLSQYFQGVARMGLEVAEALVHAHSQGVLHRRAPGVRRFAAHLATFFVLRVSGWPGASAASRPAGPRLGPNSLTLSSPGRIWLTTWLVRKPEGTLLELMFSAAIMRAGC